MRRYGAKTGTMALFRPRKLKMRITQIKVSKSPLIKPTLKYNFLRDHEAHQDNRKIQMIIALFVL
jgi:hypothetical protein